MATKKATKRTLKVNKVEYGYVISSKERGLFKPWKAIEILPDSEEYLEERMDVLYNDDLYLGFRFRVDHCVVRTVPSVKAH